MWSKFMKEHHSGDTGISNDYFENTGLFNNPQNSDSLSHKKLGYYTYKLMVEKLEGSDWNTVQTLLNGEDNIYAYKFIKKETGEPVYIAWWDWFDEPDYSEGDTKVISLEVGNVDSVWIIETVPDTESGIELNENNYIDFFATEAKPITNGSATILLGEKPVYIEPVYFPTSIDDGMSSLVPEGLWLGQNYPNPFNTSITIKYYLPRTGHVVLRILNMMGQEVRTLMDDNQSTASYSVVWDGKDSFGNIVTSSIYFLQMRVNDFVQTKRLLLSK